MQHEDLLDRQSAPDRQAMPDDRIAPPWRQRPAIAVLGGSLHHTERQVRAGFAIGFELAARRQIVITGATSGVPYAAALGAHAAGGFVVGVSPAASAEEHVRGGRPHAQADVMLYTAMGAEGRSPLIVRSASGAIFIGGEFGTLGELCAAWLCGCPVLGVLEQHGGIADSARALIEQISSTWGSQVIYASDPVILATRVSDRVATRETSDMDLLGADVRALVAPMLEQYRACPT